MSTENVQLAIRRNIELAFVKKAKVEFKGDRSEARILVSRLFNNFVFPMNTVKGLLSDINGRKNKDSLVA